MTAARTGKEEAVRALLGKGAGVNAVGPRKQTALMWAAAEGNLEVVKLLIDAGPTFTPSWIPVSLQYCLRSAMANTKSSTRS